MKKVFYFLSFLVGFVFSMACFTSCCDAYDDAKCGRITVFKINADALPPGIIDPVSGSISLAEGNQITLPFVVEPADMASQIVIISGDPSIVAVEGGKLVAKKSGETTIYVRIGGDNVAEYPIVVKPSSGIVKEFALDVASLPTGSIDPTDGSIQLAEGGDGLTLPFVVEPADMASQIVIYSADPTIVEVIGRRLIGKKEGTTKIYAEVADRIIEYPVKVGKVPVDLSTLTGDYSAQDGDVLTGTLAGNHKISIADGANVVLKDVTIDGTNNSNYSWAGITCLGDATIILKDGTTNIVKGFYENYPGIYVPVGKKLTIKGDAAGTGKLDASSNGLGAGIGGGYNISCGDILIQGGYITANGGSNAAGIGGGAAYSDVAHCGDITITGGTIIAKGGTYGAGIGTGFNNTTGYSASCGNITITGGTIDATGDSSAAGIGTGAGQSPSNKTKCGNIAIENTVVKVTAKKGEYSPNSIGTGVLGDCGTVRIGGTKYWENNAYVGDGETYLTQIVIIYPVPTIGNVYVEPFKGEDDPLATK